MLSLAMALVSVCASAQVYIGGTAGISSNKIGDGDSKTAYKLIPEIGYQFNNKWDAGIEVGIQKGEVCCWRCYYLHYCSLRTLCSS